MQTLINSPEDIQLLLAIRPLNSVKCFSEDFNRFLSKKIKKDKYYLYELLLTKIKKTKEYSISLTIWNEDGSDVVSYSDSINSKDFKIISPMLKIVNNFFENHERDVTEFTNYSMLDLLNDLDATK